MIVPVGAWCRVAFQVNQFCLKYANSSNYSYPFDWTITPFSALKFVLGKDFSVKNILDIKNLSKNNYGSLTDLYTGIVHHHDFSPGRMSELIASRKTLDLGFPDVVSTGELDQAKSRFVHCFHNLIRLKYLDQLGAIGFVRWMRHGHPDAEFPEAFEGETKNATCDVFRSFLGHDSFFVLQVVSLIVDGNKSVDNPIARVRLDGNVMRIFMIERKGFNGSGDQDFRGDTASWEAALSIFMHHFKLNLNIDQESKKQWLLAAKHGNQLF